MTETTDNAVQLVSTAINESDGNLRQVIESAQQKWQQELEEAKKTSRSLLASLLKEREAIQDSLNTVAELWRLLKPTEYDSSKANKPEAPIKSGIVTSNTQQISSVKALQNISHTLCLVEFITTAPDALERATTSLEKIKSDGLYQVVPGNPSLLVEAHAVVTAVERLRDMMKLESISVPGSAHSQSFSNTDWFHTTSNARNALEEIVIRGIFANMVQVAQQNPCFLVAAARVVISEEHEDEWWNGFVSKSSRFEAGAEVRSFGSQSYKKRALDAVIESLQTSFRKGEEDFGLVDTISHTQDFKDKLVKKAPIQISEVLEWIENRRTSVETVKRFVIPCIPPSFDILKLHEEEIHRQFMKLLTRLLHQVNGKGELLLSEPDLSILTSWYIRYKEEVGQGDEVIDSFLTDEDRQRLINALQIHSFQRISYCIESVLTADGTDDKVFENTDLASHRDDDLPGGISHDKFCRTNMPDVIFSCVKDQIDRMTALEVQGLDEAIAQTVATCLGNFQRDVRKQMSDESRFSCKDDHRLYICATANNMARCMEFSEEVRESFAQVTKSEDYSGIENRIESIGDGFRATASAALQILIQGMKSGIEVHANRFYAPHTGTELMLDVIDTLQDFFTEYKQSLFPMLFGQLAIETLKRVVVLYLKPFLLLSNKRTRESLARRFVSLPTFDHMKILSSKSRTSEVAEGEVATVQPGTEGEDQSSLDGLATLNAAAIIAQVDKDVANLTAFMEGQVTLQYKKQIQSTIEPLHALRSLFTCPASTYGLADAFREAKIIIGKALRPTWVFESGVSGQVSVQVAELIWELRKDVSPIVLLEAVNLARSHGEKLDSISPSRMSSFDEGRLVNSRTSDASGLYSMRSSRLDLTAQSGSSGLLLWTPTKSLSACWKRK